jgi:hypothetical protein
MLGDRLDGESVVKGDVAVSRPFILLEIWRPTVETAPREASRNPEGAAKLKAVVRFALASRGGTSSL